MSLSFAGKNVMIIIVIDLQDCTRIYTVFRSQKYYKTINPLTLRQYFAPSDMDIPCIPL